MLIVILILVASIILLIAAICHLLGPGTISWFSSSGEEKIGLSKSKIYNANGYIVQSGSDILLGSTGSFKRFESVDRNSNGGYVGCENSVYGQTALITPPWTTSTEEVGIPPQPLRPAPMPFSSKSARHSSSSSTSTTMSKNESFEGKKVSSAPLKSVPRPVPRKQMSAPEGVSTFPRIPDPPQNNLQKIVHVQQQQSVIPNNNIIPSTNPFLSGLVKLESIKTNLFSSSFAVEDERKTKSAFVSRNPFNTPSSSQSNYESSMFDFNPTAIRAILEETTDEGYLGDNDEGDELDPLKQLEERIQKLEASGRQQQRRRSSSGSGGGLSPKSLAQQQIVNGKIVALSPNAEQSNKELTSNVNEKFVDSSLNDESIANSYRRHIRNRSFSENETSNDLSVLQEVETEEKSEDNENSDMSTSSLITTTKCAGGNPFLNGKRLLKTPSETYLEQYSMMRANNIVNQTSQSFGIVNGKPTPLCKHPSLLKILQTSSQSTIETSDSTQSLTSLKRAQSTESISSDSSVVMSTLERPTPPVTGLLCVALQYDKNSATSEGCELLVTVLEAKDLILPADSDPDFVDTFVRVYLVPDDSGAQQTKTFRNSRHPSYQEMFGFFITKQIIKRSLWFHLYHTNANCTTLIGETEMKITEIRKPLTTWLSLSDSRFSCTNWGDMMFSLSYLPTAERLTVVVVKARNLRPGNDDEEHQKTTKDEILASELKNVYVKVYLLKNDKKVTKKRTTMKRGARNIIFNEAMIFSVPPFLLNSIQVRLTVMNVVDTADGRKSESVGHVIVGSRTDGRGLLHWHQMITSLRKPIAMFHPLRRSSSRTSFNAASLLDDSMMGTFRF